MLCTFTIPRVKSACAAEFFDLTHDALMTLATIVFSHSFLSRVYENIIIINRALVRKIFYVRYCLSIRNNFWRAVERARNNFFFKQQRALGVKISVCAPRGKTLSA